MGVRDECLGCRSWGLGLILPPRWDTFNIAKSCKFKNTVSYHTPRKQRHSYVRYKVQGGGSIQASKGRIPREGKTESAMITVSGGQRGLQDLSSGLEA